VLLTARSTEVSGVRGARLRRSVAVGGVVVVTDSARGIDRSIALAGTVDNETTTLGASCWRSVVNCARCATLKKP
jgi:hypothetical protein